MSVFTKKHLRLTVPLTKNGVNLLYDENNKPVTKTVYLPLTAKKKIVANQAKKPEHLRAKIEEVDGDFVDESLNNENGSEQKTGRTPTGRQRVK